MQPARLSTFILFIFLTHASRLRAKRDKTPQGEMSMVVDSKPFDGMVKKLMGKLGGKDDKTKAATVVKEMASLVLGRTSRDLGVSQPKGKFTKSIRKGQSHIKKRYTWHRPPVFVRGAKAGQAKPHYKHVAKMVRVGGRKFYLRKYIRYVRSGAGTIALQKLDEIRKKAVPRVASSKAIWYKIAKDARLKVNGLKGGLFVDRSHLVMALRNMPFSFRRSGSGKIIMREGQMVVRVQSTTRNALNPHIRGKATFQRKINGIRGEFNKGIREGWIKDMNDVVSIWGIDVGG